MEYTIRENDKIKVVTSEKYNYVFNYITGAFARWGETKDDDPVMAPSCEIADIEISTICSGIGKSLSARSPCSWCYKSNTSKGKNMSFETFKQVFEKISKNKILTQIAFGIGDVNANPDLFKIMHYCRDNPYTKVIPNVTINGMATQKEIKKLAEVCGAVSVSRYHISDICYSAVANLKRAGLEQVNIHQLLAEETYDSCFQLIDDCVNDNRLKELNAVVFLMLKPKGNRNKFHRLDSTEKFGKLFDYARSKKIQIGMDSCAAPFVLKKLDELNEMTTVQSIEPCESGLFSVYINVDGKFFPCSFTEGEEKWKEGIDLLRIKDFVKDVWYSPRIKEWRNNLIKSSQSCECKMKSFCRSCPVFKITPCRIKK